MIVDIVGIAPYACSLVLLLAVYFVRRPSSAQLRRSFFSAKHVWVIGGTSGIGRSVSVLAARAGASVTVTARGLKGVEEVIGEITAGGGIGRGIVGDVRGDLREMYSRVVHEGGAVDVVVLCAGINHGGDWFGLGEVGEDKAEEVIDVNFRAAVRLFGLCLPAMRRRHQGVLCAVSSLSAYRGVPGASVYGATKAALTAFCQALNVELYNSGVQVTCVHPGFVDTPAIRSLNHPKPFLVDAHTAAEHILDAVQGGKRHYGFPWIMENVIMKIAQFIPSPFYDLILYHTSSHRPR